MWGPKEDMMVVDDLQSVILKEQSLLNQHSNMELVLFVMAVFAYMVLYVVYQPKKEEEKKDKPRSIKRADSHYKRTRLFDVLGLSLDQCNTFRAFLDRFSSYEEVARAIKLAGISRSDMIIGVDFSASNEWQGRKIFGCHCLHDVSNSKTFNPYQRVLSIMGSTLEQFDSDHMIPVYGFGDKLTQDEAVFPFKDSGLPCVGFIDVLEKYHKVARTVRLGGPTSFEPIIRKAIEITSAKQSYHLLLIVTDGQIKDTERTAQAIVDASNHPISIIVIGVGDGPWDDMEYYDDNLPRRRFDNFQFVNFHQVCSKAKYAETAFALHALMEIPDQYQAICSLGYLKTTPAPGAKDSNENVKKSR
ncbi:uncharacterized protein [Diadema antillarum]|uniref:uncharacterized protein n=1 Tax=Diadema antillarum TaxID=105358 RepID=UPI003A8A88A9